MSDEDKARGMKSAYELALERLDRDGIERPREEAFPPEVLAEMDAVRRRAESKLAEAEILHRDRLIRARQDPAAGQQEEDDYRLERRRIEEERDRQLARLRGR
ncbi:MAG TPA: hypothetical protein VMT16_00135 [Thermoanaerobaculia bacterium]|nr:hypothetical protein [Thermoanaerobaculia bacterium]